MPAHRRRRGVNRFVVSTALGASLLGVGLSGCGGGDERSAPTSPPTVPSETTSVTTNANPTSSTIPFGTTTPGSATTTSRVPATTTTRPGPTTSTRPFTTSQVSAPASEQAYLRAVRVARQPGFDRVVLEFENLVPGYVIAYSKGPFSGTSGLPVKVAGDGAIVVTLHNGSSVDLSGRIATPQGFRETYPGPTRVGHGDAIVVREVVQVDDFEGVAQWALGVKGKPAFRVSTLSAPPRLVIDVETPA